MSGTELETASSKNQPPTQDRAQVQGPHFRFFLGLSTVWLVLMIVLLRMDSNPWLIAPLAIVMAALSVVAWRVQCDLGLRE